jgi:predicted DsbA family dithiol-disulfide isomerase
MEGEELPDQFRRRGGQFAEVAKAEGLEVGERTHRYNSTPAHEAALWADEQGNGEAFRKALYQAYFRDNHNIGSPDVLAKIATNLNMDAAALRQALEERRYRGEVLQQFQQAHEIGVTAVPTFVAAGYALVGAHPLENFRKLMEAAGEPPKNGNPGA